MTLCCRTQRTSAATRARHLLSLLECPPGGGPLSSALAWHISHSSEVFDISLVGEQATDTNLIALARSRPFSFLVAFVSPALQRLNLLPFWHICTRSYGVPRHVLYSLVPSALSDGTSKHDVLLVDTLYLSLQ